MKKEKFHIEYIFDKVSRHSLWNQLTTAMGLGAWFADKVNVKKDLYTFRWGKEEQQARLIDSKTEVYARYRWTDDDNEGAYFEFRIHTIELTGSTALEVTDFSEPDEKSDSIALWDTQVESLRRALGIYN